MMKSDKMIKRSTIGSRMRKRLSDITNLQFQHKSPFKNHQENLLPSVDDSFSKNSMDKLLQENTMMMKLLEEKDKIIEFNRVELQKLKVNLQKTQLQNWQLAQSNSQMLAELNMAKDRLKNLQHELACKDGLVKAKTVELQEKAKIDCETNSLQDETKSKEAAVEQPLEESNNININNNSNNTNSSSNCNTNSDNNSSKNKNNNNANKVPKAKRGRPTRSQSMGPTTSQQAVDKLVVENKRRCLRRQSVRLKPLEKQDDLFELDVVSSPVDQTMDISCGKSNSNIAEDGDCFPESLKNTGPQRSVRPLEKQDDLFEFDVVSSPVDQTMDISCGKSNSDIAEDGDCFPESSKNTAPQRSSIGGPQHKTVKPSMDISPTRSNSDIFDDRKRLSEPSRYTGSQRSSIGRPQRKATEKVQSYKDLPLNIKMRRP